MLSTPSLVLFEFSLFDAAASKEREAIVVVGAPKNVRFYTLAKLQLSGVDMTNMRRSH